MTSGRQSLPVPVVSVVLPTFNRLRFLRQTLESVFAQTFTEWELIVADDGSDETTRHYLQTLESEPRVTVLWLSHTGIPAVVRNAGLRAARGEYIAFLDSDDLWAPRKLERQLAALRANRRCRWSYTAFSQIDESGVLLPDETHRLWEPHAGAIFRLMALGKVSIRTPSVLARRDVIEKVGGFDETILSAEDYDLWLRLALDGELALVNEPLLQVRRHAENYSSSWENAFAGRDRALLKMQSRVAHQHRSLLKLERVKNALKRAATHASLGATSNTLRALRASLSYSWSYPRWWVGALKLLLKPLLKPSLPRRATSP
jgi:glycosyltransferase involved in cell wall biosynthesis